MTGRGWLLVLAIAAALVAGGCGDDDEDSGGGGGEGAGEQTTLTVGLIPIADVAPLYLGIDQGFFEDQNLKIEPQLAEGGAAITPAVLSGDFQIGFSNTVSLLIAASKDLPVTIISQGVLGGKTEDEAWADLLVLKDGPVKQPKDIEGKTIAVNTLKNICEVTIRASLADMGVDDSTLKFTEVPFPDMNAALEANRVDGACVVEPFVSQAKAAGSTGIDPFYVKTAPNLSVATYFTSKQYAEQNPEVLKRFARAMNKSLDYTDKNPDAARKVLSEYTEIPKPAIAKIRLPQWSSQLDPASLELQADLAELKSGRPRASSRPDVSKNGSKARASCTTRKDPAKRNPPLPASLLSGRYRDRTSDLLLVRQALSQLS